MPAATFADPWAFEPNPEVYVLVAFLVGAYIYMVRNIGPNAVEPGTPVITRRQRNCFIASMLILFFASTWPVHQIGEGYLYSAHMVQHFLLSYVLPPLVLLATPEWLLRALVGQGRTYRVVRFFSKPVVAAVIFNLMVMVLHVPGVVNASTTNGVLHFSLHLFVVLTAVLMWMPVVGPLPELQMSYGGKMIYLFLQSVVPTLPAAWLTFADGVVYSHYGEQPVRVWGLSPIDDQQLAAVIMKIFGGMYLWTIVIFMFFRRFGKGVEAQNSYRRSGRMPAAEITGTDEFPLTYGEVADAFGRTEAPTEPTADERR
ncbi:MAG: cytochrome c oxidase assembly protein [Actinobacteria bacterium]|nr:cytochrome c oxidase assembly protein [Actinomycetota bacterium]